MTDCYDFLDIGDTVVGKHGMMNTAKIGKVMDKRVKDGSNQLLIKPLESRNSEWVFSIRYETWDRREEK